MQTKISVYITPPPPCFLPLLAIIQSLKCITLLPQVFAQAQLLLQYRCLFSPRAFLTFQHRPSSHTTSPLSSLDFTMWGNSPVCHYVYGYVCIVVSSRMVATISFFSSSSYSEWFQVFGHKHFHSTTNWP